MNKCPDGLYYSTHTLISTHITLPLTLNLIFTDLTQRAELPKCFSFKFKAEAHITTYLTPLEHLTSFYNVQKPHLEYINPKNIKRLFAVKFETQPTSLCYIQHIIPFSVFNLKHKQPHLVVY